jgi:hypothetical protein
MTAGGIISIFFGALLYVALFYTMNLAVKALKIYIRKNKDEVK